jgi:hypothetical protein
MSFLDLKQKTTEVRYCIYDEIEVDDFSQNSAISQLSVGNIEVFPNPANDLVIVRLPANLKTYLFVI